MLGMVIHFIGVSAADVSRLKRLVIAYDGDVASSAAGSTHVVLGGLASCPPGPYGTTPCRVHRHLGRNVAGFFCATTSLLYPCLCGVWCLTVQRSTRRAGWRRCCGRARGACDVVGPVMWWCDRGCGNWRAVMYGVVVVCWRDAWFVVCMS